MATQRYTGLLFGALAALFLLLALTRRNRGKPGAIQARAFTRIGLIFVAVSLFLLISSR